MPDTEPPRAVAYLEALHAALPASLLGVGLLRGAWRSGFLRAAQEPSSPAAIARRAGTDPALAQPLADALVAFGVLDRTDAGDVLTDAWRPLLLTDPPIAVDTALDWSEATGRLVESVAEGGPTYWTGDAALRRAYAVGVSADPTTEHGRALVRFVSSRDQRMTALLSTGGRLLELGCGVAGTLLVHLQGHPGLTAVGVELDPDLVAVARSRAERLGVADRVRFVCADAAEFADDEPFDFAFWSQFFFPAESRAATLAAAHRSLRPGALFSAPLLGEPESDPAVLRTDDGRARAVQALLHRGWGVPHRSAQDLMDEMVAAGFVDPLLDDLGHLRIVRATRP
jgi:hypothetical protein